MLATDLIHRAEQAAVWNTKRMYYYVLVRLRPLYNENSSDDLGESDLGRYNYEPDVSVPFDIFFVHTSGATIHNFEPQFCR